MITVAALYVERGGPYWDLPGVDPWDIERDARTYAGPHPVVAHPPCERWSLLAGLVEARYGLRRGDDGGCFAAALAAVHRWGGVIEHPAGSAAWHAYGLRHPHRGGWTRTAAGWTCSVDQGRYGHRAIKATWLYACGVDPGDLPELMWGLGSVPTARISEARGRRGDPRHGARASTTVERMAHRERRVTPVAFRDALLAIARLARPDGNRYGHHYVSAPDSSSGNPTIRNRKMIARADEE